MPRARRLRILCIHGVGRHQVGGAWEEEWGAEVRSALRDADSTLECELGFLHYDDLFEKYPLTFLGTLEALGKLAVSGITAPFRARGAARGVSSSVRWTAGMVVKWVEDARFRRESRTRVAERLAAFSSQDPRPPDVVLAHSLGTLVLYDTLSTERDLDLARTRVVTFGSQIANPFVSGQFLAGRIQPLDNVDYWYNLYNPEDDVFTASIHLAHPRFEEVRTLFDVPGIADHSAPHYLAHPETAGKVWCDLALDVSAPRAVRARQAPKSVRLGAAARPPRRRALLVGINEYPDQADCLEGCVNDVFLMSSVLQESGYEAEDIRVVLDRRATARGITERLEWLLDGVASADVKALGEMERVFYYSGHGAQLPTYGKADRVDQMDETLVPYDFDWSSETAFTDDSFRELYTQLPYGLRFLTLFDCCHSGGMTRDGGPRVRGLDPPDDIRHRALRWDPRVEMWKERELESKNREFQRWVQRRRKTTMTRRLGHAMDLRQLPSREFNRRRRELGHYGPYMPLLVYACREDEVAMEYRHGSVSYGAFTFALAKQVRAVRKSLADLPAVRRARAQPSFEKLVSLVQSDLRKLGYEQHPQLAGPVVARSGHVPLFPPPPAPKQPRRRPRAKGATKAGASR